MKKIVTNAVLMMAFVFVLTAAGYSQQPLLKADVPFEFNVGKKTFPAGEYQIIRVADRTLTLRGENNQTLITFLTQSAMTLTPYNNPKLKFKVVGGQHLLAEIWMNRDNNGYEVLPISPLNVIAKTPSAPEGQTATATYVGK